MRRDREPSPPVEPEGFQRPGLGIDDPCVSDARPCVGPHLPDPVEASGRRGEDLADPVGCKGEEGSLRKDGKPLPAPARQVRDEDVPAQVELGFGNDPPPPGPPRPRWNAPPTSIPSVEAASAWGLAGRGDTCNSPSRIWPVTCGGRASVSVYGTMLLYRTAMATETTYSHARAHFAALCDEACSSTEPVIIHRRGARDVALISAAELRSLQETAHLLRSPKNARRLLAALERARARTGVSQTPESIRHEFGLAKDVSRRRGSR